MNVVDMSTQAYFVGLDECVDHCLQSQLVECPISTEYNEKCTAESSTTTANNCTQKNHGTPENIHGDSDHSTHENGTTQVSNCT